MARLRQRNRQLGPAGLQALDVGRHPPHGLQQAQPRRGCFPGAVAARSGRRLAPLREGELRGVSAQDQGALAMGGRAIQTPLSIFCAENR